MKRFTLISMLTVLLLVVSGFAAVLAAELSIFSPDAWGVTFRDGRLAIISGPQGQFFAKSVGGTTPFCLCDGTNFDQPWVLVEEYPEMNSALYAGPGNTSIMVDNVGAPAKSCPCESGACATATEGGSDTDDGDNDGEDPDGEDPDGEDPDDDDPDDADNGDGHQHQEQNQEQEQEQEQEQTGPKGNSGGENPGGPKH